MSGYYVFDGSEVECIIKIVNVFLICIFQLLSQVSRYQLRIRSARDLLWIRPVKDKGEKTEVSLWWRSDTFERWEERTENWMGRILAYGTALRKSWPLYWRAAIRRLLIEEFCFCYWTKQVYSPDVLQSQATDIGLWWRKAQSLLEGALSSVA